MRKTYKINDLEQVRLLSDPLKLRILQAFAESPKTTRHVATELGENVTKLYRHVDKLHDAGLLVVVDERQKRGTVERTFEAVAQRFEADHSLFSDESGDAGAAAAREILRAGEAEIVDVLAKTRDDALTETIVTRIRGKASPAKIAELRATLNEWIESLPDDTASSSEQTTEYGGLIAFYEID